MSYNIKLQTRAKVAYKWLPNNINNLLDVGCASGYFTVYFKNKAKNICGVDINKNLIEEAKKNYKGVKFILLKSEKLPFKSNTFDVVTILDVLEHVDNDKIMINEIYRVLKKNGLLILSVPNQGLFTFLDADNIKITMPYLYRVMYFIVKRDSPLIKKEKHKHYSIRELNELIKYKFKIEKVHIGASIISTIISYLEILIYRMYNKRYLNTIFTIIKNFDYSINYGRLGDNIIIKAKKI